MIQRTKLTRPALTSGDSSTLLTGDKVRIFDGEKEYTGLLVNIDLNQITEDFGGVPLPFMALDKINEMGRFESLFPPLTFPDVYMRDGKRIIRYHTNEHPLVRDDGIIDLSHPEKVMKIGLYKSKDFPSFHYKLASLLLRRFR